MPKLDITSTRSSPQTRPRSSPRGRSNQSPRSHPREGITSQRAVNERAIRELMHRLVPYPTLPRVRCEHGLRPLKLCYGKKSETNLGRWYTFCAPCERWEWLSESLDLLHLRATNEELDLLMSIRESLRPPTKGPESPTPRLPPANLTLVFWSEDLMNPQDVQIARPSGGAFCLNDYKVLLGTREIERGDAYEIYDNDRKKWLPMEWDRFVYCALDESKCFRRKGVTCMPDFSRYR